MPNAAHRDVRNRVEDFLTNEKTDKDLSKGVLDLVLSAWRSTGEKVTRILGVLVILAIFFMLIATKGVQEFSISGVKVANLHLVGAAIPPLMAVLLLRALMLDVDARLLSNSYFELTRQAFPGLRKSELDSIIAPSDLLIVIDTSSALKGTLLGKILNMAARVEASFFISLPGAFSIYAYVKIFSFLHVTNPLTWISLSLSVVLYSLALAIGFLSPSVQGG